MISLPLYFDLHELVCEDVFKTYKETAWSFFDGRLLNVIDTIRKRINKRIIVNTWHEGGKFDERGFRCLRCSLVRKAIEENRMYQSAHMAGQAFDFDVEGLVAEEVRQWIIKNANLIYYPIRIENNVTWVHIDTRNISEHKIQLFN